MADKSLLQRISVGSLVWVHLGTEKLQKTGWFIWPFNGVNRKIIGLIGHVKRGQRA